MAKKSKTLRIDFWREPNGSIHITARDFVTGKAIPRFHTYVDAKKHSALFALLDEQLPQTEGIPE